MANSTAVEFQKISKTVGHKKILDDITLSANQGEIFGLLGPNGAGKTTMMRIMTGLIKPTSGKVYMNGIDLIKNYEQALNYVGAIIENPELYKHLSGYMNLKVMGNMYIDTDRKKIEQAAEIAGISERLSDKVKTYSLGMRQRLGIAVALINEPKILILDEPLNGLDPEGVRDVRDALKRLSRKKGVCIIISSHILSEMELVCDRFALISGGKLIDTKNIGDTSAAENFETHFKTLTPNNPAKLQQILQQFNITPEMISDKEFMINLNEETISKVITALVTASIQIKAVIPQKQSLEDYFMAKMKEEHQ